MTLSKVHITGTIQNAQALADVRVSDGYDVLLDHITLLDRVQMVDGYSQEVAEYLQAVTATKRVKRLSRKIKVSRKGK